MKQRRLKTNFALNVVGMGLPLIIALITVPLYISHIGTVRYGVLAIVWILLGYFGFLDLGLSRATANALAKISGASRKKRAGILVTSLYLNLFLGLIGGVALYSLGGFLIKHLLTLNEPFASEVNASLPWIAGMFPLLMLLSMSRGAIESKEHFLAVNLIDLVGYALGQILPLLAAIFIAPTLPVVLSAAFAARATSVLITLSFVIVTEKISNVLLFNTSRLKEFVTFGAWVSVTNIFGPILQFLDQLLVGSALGASAVAHYAIPMNLVVRSQIVAAALARAVFPRFSKLSRDKAIKLGESSVVSLGFVYGAPCAAGIILSKPFMDIWMGHEFSLQAAPVLEALLIGAWINGVAFIPFALLQGQGRPDLVAKLHAWEILPYVGLLWFALNNFGLIGGAVLWSIRVTVDALLLLKLANFRFANLAGLLLGFCLIFASYAAIQIVEISPALSALVAASVFALFVVCAMIFDANLRRIALSMWQWKLGLRRK